MPALYPMTVAPEDFKVGDTVRKSISDRCFTPYVGVVTNILPSIYKVDVQWPRGSIREDPEELILVHPIFGLPTVRTDSGYSSYDKGISEKFYGKIPKQVRPYERMAIRVAHNFASKTIGKLVDDIVECHQKKLSEVQTYNRVYGKFASICSDYIIRSSIERIYKSVEE